MKILTIGNAFEVNPRVSIKRGTEVPFISMDRLKPGHRDVTATETRAFSSGSKFEAGDTLMARITPCLENRKIARYLPENAAEKAAGSTEFIVLRGKPGVTITDFAYYFATTPDIHDLSVSLMTGTSGRQRVDIDALCATQVTIPDLRTQHSIVSILGSLDDKIAANTRVINSSITLAESLVDRGIRSTRVRLGDVARITMGTSPKGEYLKEEVGGLPFYQGVRDFDDLTPQKRVFTENPVREAEAGDILFAVRAPVGEVNIASEPTAIGRGLAAIRGLNNHVALFYLLRSHPKIWNTHQDNGTVFASINKTDLSNALIPEIEMDQSQYDLLAKLHNQSLVLTSQNFILAKTRDELLPLLMSGKITVREAKQETAAAGVNIAGEEHEA
ncbi:restriction endonuclease subunit S [Corynebacterium genitalium ATCC 33030]|nr:restriction endonuclease subunit S [Corynebacterium genitalium]UUA89313.1 restriction endonuclease subunit S [Corynebacterium genitalium ATCC 33030]